MGRFGSMSGMERLKSDWWRVKVWLMLEKCWRVLGREIHQSYLVVGLCVGIVAGAILAIVFKINYFASMVWIWFAVGLLVIAYLKPKMAFVGVAVIAGMVLVFVRAGGELQKQQLMGREYNATSGLETETWVVETRDWFAERIRGLMPEPEVGLGLSYLLGMKAGLDDELSENLRVVGLTHIVVASGAHLAILVGAARKVFGRLSRFAGLIFSVIFVVFFMAMVGWTASILRAGIMTILTLLAWYSGRKIEPWRMILVVMAVTLMINPNYLTSMGWQLSFASYGGIMMLGPRLAQLFYGSKKPGWVASTVITTVAATMMTLPIILYYFGAVSLISVVANLLILPTLPWAMGMVFMTGVVAGLPGIEVAVGWCAKLLLDFHIAVVGWFGGMKEFLVEIPRYQWQVFLLYGLIMGLVVLFEVWRKRKKYGRIKA